MSAAGVVEGVTELLGVAGSITTLVSLAALSLLIAYLLADRWLRGKSSEAERAIAKSDNDALALLLGGTKVPLDQLSANQKFTLATEELRTRSRQRIISYTLVFFSFLALLASAIALAFFSRSELSVRSDGDQKLVQIDLLGALEILRLVPEAGRTEACVKLLSESDCERAGPTIRALEYREPTPKQDEVLEQALARGGVTKEELQELAACDGSFAFRVENNWLACADGTPIPSLAIPDLTPRLIRPEAIVFHSTMSPNDSFGPVARLLASGREDLPGPLAHLVISRSGAVAQVAAFDQAAMHAGRTEPWRGIMITNSNSIGIELINQGIKHPYTKPQIAAAEGIARALERTYGIKAIVGHAEISPGRKVDPGPLFPIGEIREAAGLSTS